MLTALGKDAEALRSAFHEAIADEKFLASLKNAYDVYVTYDHKQRTRTAEARAITEAGVTAHWFGPFWGKMDFWEQAKWLVTRWEQIDAFASNVTPGTCAEITQKGKARVFTLK